MAEIDFVTHYNSRSPVSEAYRAIRTNLQFAGAGKKNENHRLYVGRSERREIDCRV